MEAHEIGSRVLAGIGRAMGHFSMLRPGDRVAVGVSGGKDSLCLLHALASYRRRAPFAYELVAITVQQGKFTGDIRAIEKQIAGLGVPWIVRDDAATLTLVGEGIVHGCDVCSRHRRRALYRLADAEGCTALALGHTADDCAEALLRNILFNGRIASLPPVARSRKGALRLIRPLVYVTEDLTAEYARAHGFLTVGCVCGERTSVRGEIRRFLASLKAGHGGVPESVMAALANVNPYTLFDLALSKEGGGFLAGLHGSARLTRRVTGAEPPYLYLTTTGRRSGQPREIEIWFTERGGRYYVVAEHRERAHWVQNVVAEPRVTVRVGNVTSAAHARVVDARAEPELVAEARARSEKKYGWSDGLVVELSPLP